MGGDLLPSGMSALMESGAMENGFVSGFMALQFEGLRQILRDKYPEIFLILGNDDGRFEEDAILKGEEIGLWHYAHNRRFSLGEYAVYGYSYIPPSPFLLKDWERYDVSRYVDPGCVPPEEGFRSRGIPDHEVMYGTIADDLQALFEDDDLGRSVLLFHAPPHKTALDRCANDGKMIDFVPLETHIGSIAIKRLIESRQPRITLHGHVHESARITGCWREIISLTHSLSAAHDGPELSLVRFDLENPSDACRALI